MDLGFPWAEVGGWDTFSGSPLKCPLILKETFDSWRKSEVRTVGRQVGVTIKRKRENIKSNNRNTMLKSKEWRPTPKSVAEERSIYPPL